MLRHEHDDTIVAEDGTGHLGGGRFDMIKIVHMLWLIRRLVNDFILEEITR